jgi:hypothetical protein
MDESCNRITFDGKYLPLALNIITESISVTKLKDSTKSYST